MGISINEWKINSYELEKRLSDFEIRIGDKEIRTAELKESVAMEGKRSYGFKIMV